MILTAKIMKETLAGCARSLKLSHCLTATSTGSCSSSRLMVSTQTTHLHTSSVNQLPGGDWRKKNKLPVNPNAYGVLTDGPDYSFLDGRSTPPGTGRVRRAREQYEVATKILKLTEEVDFAVSQHAAREKERQQDRANKIAGKLKPKGRLPPEVTSK